MLTTTLIPRILLIFDSVNVELRIFLKLTLCQQVPPLPRRRDPKELVRRPERKCRNREQHIPSAEIKTISFLIVLMKIMQQCLNAETENNETSFLIF